MNKECRICFGEEDHFDRLIKPWNCKGSMQYVHEKCINQWINHAWIDKCDLWGYKLKTIEKFLNPLIAVKRLLKYMNRDKKRYVYWSLYLIYLYLYGKRFGRVMTSFLSIFRWDKNSKVISKLSILKTLFSFVYNLLLFTQLIYLGAAESKRIWNIVNIISKQIKSIKILDRGD